MSNPRKLVFSALNKTENGGYSNLVLNSLLDLDDLSGVDLNFASALFYGVLERKITLDYIIENQSGRKRKDISQNALTVLRMGLYQMLYMDKVPDSAAINESVKIIKKTKQSYLSGFVNAVLRNCQRNKELLFPSDNLSLKYSCPEWIIGSLVDDYGFQTASRFLEYSLLTPQITARVNTVKISADGLIENLNKNGVTAEKSGIENYITLKNIHNISREENYLSGYYHIQDLASANCVLALNPQKGERVLDVCAAPGGKTFSIAEKMENTGEIIACDIHPHRVSLIQKGASRLGLNVIKPTVNDAQKFNKSFGEFDRVLCDVPCSGLGVIGRKPDIKYKEKSDFDALMPIQFQILNTSKDYLKKGGILVYSTCTVRKAENERVVEKFLSQNTDFKLLSSKTYFPFTDGTDGFFIAVLSR